jgi:hypothetical protein
VWEADFQNSSKDRLLSVGKTGNDAANIIFATNFDAMRWKLAIVWCLFVSRGLWCQEEKKLDAVVGVNISGAYVTPAGDWRDRFGAFTNLGLETDWIFPSNWLLGVQGNFLFGSNVKEDVLAHLRTADGFIISNNQFVADIQLRMRGWYFGGNVGKLFPLFSSNPRAGLRITVGGGWLQHKIRIQDEVEADVAGLSGDYKKGYDRLTSGYAISEFIGYQLLSQNRRVNFYAGLELGQAFTQSQRSFDFDRMQRDTEKHLDLYYGLKLAWTLPFYIRETGEEILY